MSLPNLTPTFYRMADVSPATSDIAGLLGACLTALQATVDYLGTSLPSSHLWTATSRTNAISITPPSGTAMALTPAWVLAGQTGAPTPTMLTDTFAASNLLIASFKNVGAWIAYDNANPFTSGQFSGYYRGAGTTWNSTTAKVRIYISQEIILIQLIGSTVTNQAWLWFGAIVQPASPYATSSLDAETDDHLYGMGATGGTGAMTAAWLSSGSGTQAPFNHGASGGQCHQMVFQPGTGSVYTCNRKTSFVATATGTECQTSGGIYVGDLVPVVRSSNGARLGTLRGFYMIGQLQSGKGSPALGYHVVSPDTGAIADAIWLKAA